MRRRHAAFSTPDAVLFDLVARATRRQPIRSERIVQGYDNEVYAVEKDDGASFIVRLHRFGEVSLTQEAWALEQCRRQGVPVPEVLGLETLTTADGRREVMVQYRLPGRPLSAILPTLGPGERARVLFQAGEALRGIDKINVGGYTEELALSGIIDFGGFQGGAPIHDLAYLALEQPDLPLGPLLTGYDDARMVGPAFADQLRRY